MEAQSDIEARISSIEPIPATAAAAYESAQEVLTRHVDKLILQHPEIERLLGGNPTELLENNHRNHAGFILEVMKLNDFELLARTLPWVYSTYHNQGIDFDYFQIELRAWSDAIKSEIDGSLASPLIQLYEWMILQHQKNIELSKLETTLEPIEPFEDRWMSQRTSILAAINARDHEECLNICNRTLSQGASLPEVFQYIVYPVMAEVGVRWEQGEITVAGEHEATAIVNKVISGLYFLEEKPRTTHSTALVTTVPGESHEMGAWIMSICLELDGWDVIYLGADTPHADIVDCAEKNKVKLVALSIAMPFGIAKTRKLIASLRDRNVLKRTKIIVGGGLFQRFPFLAETLEIDAHFNDVIKALSWVRTISEEHTGL